MTDLPKAYDAQEVESKWYHFWESNAYFRANPESSKTSYSLVMPPPNVTGQLHMGHALVSTLQDCLARWKRMLGFEVLWVPGTDHAGIATQTVVERHLIKTTGKRRKDFSREEFLSHVWKWKEQNEERILLQIRRLGCSCDWSRLRFTMDEGNNRAVRQMFKKLFDEDLIYRGDYLVNWDPVTQTALADDEVEYEERQSHLWYFRYPLKGSDRVLTIATTRPETMLGDTGIAVSPKDPRYEKLIGQTVILPLVGREIPIFADHHVDPEFGTGVVKVTPAHDPNDYQMGLEHDLPFVNIMTPDGKINENGGQFQGLTMAEARKAVVQAMEEQGLLEKVAPHPMRVGVSYRSKATIEPYLSKQWFVRMSRFAEHLRDAVTKERTRLIPKNWENTYFHWIDNLRDWCISRQLWWGHRIPIWYHREDENRILCFAGEGVPPEVEGAPEEWIQDEDVLDTWFSSALWPFSTMGWPEETPELSKFYPLSVMVTGHDILFFWVARMMMMGEYARKELPFPEVFLHGLVYGKSYWRDNPDGGITYVSDEERLKYDLGETIPKDVKSRWEKMSKSKGNIIDPIEIIETYGTDAMRMALCASGSQQREIDLDRRRFEDYKNFANKVWNGARFIFMNLEANDGLPALGSEELAKGLNTSLFHLEDRWILSALNRVVKEVNERLTNYQFEQAASVSYDFFWKEFCSYYLEISKPVLFGKGGTQEERTNKQILLVIVLNQLMRLMHPMAPFITEELFQRLRERFPSLKEPSKGCDPYSAETIRALMQSSCMIAPYPQVVNEADIDPEINDMFDRVERLIYTIRNIRGEMKLPPGVATEVYVIGREGEAFFESIRSNQKLLTSLVRIEKLHFLNAEPQLEFASGAFLDGLHILLPLPKDLLEKEKTRLEKEKERLSKQVERLQVQLSNKEFTEKAPQQLVQKQRDQMNQAQEELQALDEKLAKLK